MDRRTYGWGLLCLAVSACGGSSVAVVGPGPGGKTYVHSEGGALPPVDATVGEKGIEPAPTATPGQPTPEYPVPTPAAVSTPERFPTQRPA